MEKTTSMATATTPARRTVGEYMLGERIGSGSFSVVWRGWHLRTGEDVAVKEIEKGNLNPKVRDSLIKEITILHEVSHSNIVRFHEAIQTVDKIYLVLEYCAGGDLAAYILRHGRVDDGVARHFMRQLASGLQCLWENNLIHRDLKPQNLLLSTKEDTLVLKIADFGFARYLLPQGLADTLCGSPLYMAPEIIQNKKYDAKADLWSVGAILFQLVTGKPPFNGNNQFQLFQNILSSNELQFPQEVFLDLSPDCVDLCRSLLRHDPVERLSFDGFFSHRFLTVPRMSESTPEIMQNTADDNLGVIDGDSSDSLHVLNLKIGSMDQGFLNTNAAKVSASLESIEREYVLVDAHSASMDLLSSSLEISFRDSFTTRPSYVQNEVWKDTAGPRYIGEIVSSSVSMRKSRGGHVSTPLSTSRPTISLREVHGTMSSHPSRRLQSLFSYVEALTELAQEKLKVGSHLESFSIELVILALWKEALRVCNFWIKTSTPAVAASTSDYPKIDHSSVELEPRVDFRTPSSVCSRAEIEFLIAYDRAEKISNNFREIDGSMMMPDAMEIIYQTALSAGKSGGVNQLLGDTSTAVASYSRAITLLTFIMAEAPLLPVRPPFSLSMDDQRRISRYITSLRHLKQDQST